jgi:hypothetical protein
MARPLRTEKNTQARKRWPPSQAVKTAKRKKKTRWRGLMRAVRHGGKQQIGAAIGGKTSQQLQTLAVAPQQSALALLAPSAIAAVRWLGQQNL